MKKRGRSIAYWIFAIVAAASIVRALVLLPQFGTFRGAYSVFVQHASVPLRRIDNAATAVNFDIRAFDTLGEEFIFFVSVAGVLLMFSSATSETTELEQPREGTPTRMKSPATRWYATSLCAFLAAMAINVAAHTTITPGGGFQGGAIFGSAVACIYLGAGFHAVTRAANKTLFEAFETLGALSYAAIGMAMAFVTGVFLKNILPMGTVGATVSGGMVQLINAAVFIEIACGFSILLLAFIHQTRLNAEPGE